ncbi:RDD family protein [Trichloromonas sp.]|uniref:RDD family protein n=1 Tax=Trichloromonas sp. TaxID=3069249 RepID=UPI002A4133C3|nr:RDD family protein [Trichloromonas sp.]
MNLTCPHCGFSKEIDPAQIPAGMNRVICPRCKEPFPRPEVLAESAPDFGEAPPVSAVAEADSLPMESPRAIPPGPPMTYAESLPKAGFWMRAVASLLDSLLLGLVQFVFSLVLGITAGSMFSGVEPHGEAFVGLMTTLFGILVGLTYAIFFTGYCGQTPGKMALHIKVIRTTGEEISYGRAFVREVPGKFLSGILLGIGYLMVAFDRQKQGLHDRIADTYVIKL